MSRAVWIEIFYFSSSQYVGEYCTMYFFMLSVALPGLGCYVIISDAKVTIYYYIRKKSERKNTYIIHYLT